MNFIYKIVSLFAGLMTMTLVLGVSWHYSNNFQIWQASDWVWLYQHFNHPLLSPYIRYSPWVLLLSLIHI